MMMWQCASKLLPAFALLAAFSSCSTDSPGEHEPEAEWRVVEYVPAPGQFINEQAELHTHAEACRWAEERLAKGLSVSLGSFGGYIVVTPGRSFTALTVRGNSFVDDATGTGGSNEPGIVFVMADANGNGVPDDGPWRELPGSEPSRACTVSYRRPEGVREAVAWSTSEGESGRVAWLSYHRQDSYFPAWIDDDVLTFADARRIDSRVALDEATGQWVLPPYDYGYADNHGSDCVAPGEVAFVLDAPADFVKVQTAVLASAGHLGELSTEVTAFKVTE